jgi:hypothetical protein
MAIAIFYPQVLYLRSSTTAANEKKRLIEGPSTGSRHTPNDESIRATGSRCQLKGIKKPPHQAVRGRVRQVRASR